MKNQSIVFSTFRLKQILIDGKIKGYPFVRGNVGQAGNIVIEKAEVEAARIVLAEYKTKNMDLKDLWGEYKSFH